MTEIEVKIMPRNSGKTKLLVDKAVSLYEEGAKLVFFVVLNSITKKYISNKLQQRFKKIIIDDDTLITDKTRFIFFESEIIENEFCGYDPDYILVDESESMTNIIEKLIALCPLSNILAVSSERK